jgi:predicted dehydrogenase
MTIKFAFAGIRHGHCIGLYNAVKDHPDLEIVAVAEEDPAGAGALLDAVEVTHNNIDQMLAEVDCDVVATGDYYAKRGSILIRAMELGKHVIADKPLCTSLDELDRIEELAKAKNLKVGCMLDFRLNANMVKVRQLALSGHLGEVHAISFGGQHPLLWGTRPAWYFEAGKHGGTINDIAIHGIDIIEWMTGMKFTAINGARTWNAFATECPHFNDAGQFMLTMENGCGVMGDVSYFAPDSCGYVLPYYWDFKIWGTNGVVRATSQGDHIEAALNGNKGISMVSTCSEVPPNYLEQFLSDLAGAPGDLDTATVIRSSRVTLKIQHAADKGMTSIKL